MAKGRKLTISRSERFLGGYSNGQVSNRNDVSELLEEDVWSVIDMSANAPPEERLVLQDSVRMANIPVSRHVAASAPVHVPDWSKILRNGSVESLTEMDGGDESEMVPPHVYLAREYARSRNAAANSVFEGVGRTLKGRDLRRVRDAVWSQTGFNG